MQELTPIKLPLMQDPLSGLVSRSGLESFLARYQPAAPTQPLTMLVVELSRFGSVNESMGAALGNKIIKTIAKRLTSIFANAALIARTHGNHFCLLFEGDIDVDMQVELLNDFTQRPLALNGQVIVLTVCIGIASLGPLVESPAELLHAAEVALHRAKREGLKHSVYQSHFVSEAKAVHQLENDLRVSLVTHHAELHKAIMNDEFTIVYQPIVDVKQQTVHAFEALMRWHHPIRGIVSPSVFIPMAESIQLMDVLGSWIMRRACMEAMTFPANADGSLPAISVNVSGTQFHHPDILLNTIAQALQASGLPASRLKIEITESTAFGMKKSRIVNQIREMGCKIALDDFGTGFSSLTQLIATPLDVIKLDTSFIQAIGRENHQAEERSDKLTRAVLSIAQALHMQTIVEGVETKAQCDRLIHYGANLIQGFYYSQPLPLAQAIQFVAEFNQKPR